MTQADLFRNDRYIAERTAVKTYSSQLSYGELFSRAASHTSIKGSVIAADAELSPEWLILLYACLINDAVLAVIPPNLTDLQRENIISEIAPDIYLHSEENSKDSSLPTVKGFAEGKVQHLLCCGHSANRSILPDTFLVLFTSGSSGVPKGVCLTKENLLTDMYAISEIYLHEPNSVYLHVMPFFHIFGIISAITTLWECGTLCIGGGIKTFIQDLTVFSPTSIDIVPEAASYLLKRVKQSGKNLIDKRLRTILCGGAQVNENIIADWAELGVTVLGCYGMTECAACVCFADSDCTPGSAGRVLSCNEVRIGDDGLVYVRGSNVMAGYLSGDRSRFSGEWFCTGDYGYFNDRGDLFVTGRSDSMITTESGENIPFSKVEKLLCANPLVKAAKLLHRTTNGRTIPTIYLKVQDNADKERLKRWAASVLGIELSSMSLVICYGSDWMNDKILGSEKCNEE